MHLKKLLALMLVSVVCSVLLQACDKKNSNPIPDIALAKLAVNTDGTGFVDSNAKPLRPFGFNYTGTIEFPLLEDQWDRESSWPIFEEDIKDMQALGANVVRIHLQLHHYMNGIDSVNQDSLNRLRRLVDLIGEHDMYIDVTGLAAYRKSEQPRWYVELSETDRWSVQANFWQSVASALAGRNHVFAYNLMNEPVAVDQPDSEWLPGEGFGSFHFVQSVTLDTGGRASSVILRLWMQKMVNAIRLEDEQTLVTVGFLPLGDYAQYADVLDYLSPHYYPRNDDVQASIDHVTANVAGVPLVIEEIYPLFCGIDELIAFIEATNTQVAGFLTHYDGRSVQALKQEGTLGAAIRAAWLEKLPELRSASIL